MDRRALLAVALAALAATTGCSALGIGDDGPSPGDFPAASEIDASTYDAHAATLANTSFTVTFRVQHADYRPYENLPDFDIDKKGTRTVSVDPVSGEFLLESNGTWRFLGQLQNGSVYANESVHVVRDDDENGSIRVVEPTEITNESSPDYLWGTWGDRYLGTPFPVVSENVTYERVGVETRDGVPVARYEADDVDALTGAADWDQYENAAVDRFSATLLLDEDGVIRHLGYDVDYRAGLHTVNRSVSVTVTAVGSTTVERPAWATNVSAP